MKEVPQAATDTLKRFGRTPDGLPEWRLIWANEKLSVADGKLVQEYAHLLDRWILERWVINPISREDWEFTRDQETHEYILGDYQPFSYELAYAFPQYCEMGSSVIELIPRLITAGLERYTFSERLTAAKARLQKNKEDWEKRYSDIWDDCQAPFNGAAMEAYGGHRIRGPQDIPVSLSTADLPPELRDRRGFGQL